MNTNDSNDRGVVIRKTNGHYTLLADGRHYACVLAPKLSQQLGNTSTDPVAIGDQVCFDGHYFITSILPRRNKFSRQATVPGRRLIEQIVAANVDQVIPVFAAANPTPKWGLLDRYLVAAEAAGIPALICITKLDLAKDGLEATIDDYRRLGYPVQYVSALDGTGLDELKLSLRGRLSVLLGKSGVGKSTLLNALQPGLGQRVQQVSQGRVGKGRHTTTQLEMFELDGGGALVDTPGIREFSLWDVLPDELANCFPEMRPLIGQCHFGLDCRHDQEPGCAIRQAVVAGMISPLRYRSYQSLRAEL
jgi:ribosome biogenesis GTPase